MATQSQLVDYFRSLDRALDEHKRKGTPQGDDVYQRIYEQLAGDLAPLGVGKDQIAEVAKSCGQGSTFERLQKLMKKPVGFKGPAQPPKPDTWSKPHRGGTLTFETEARGKPIVQYLNSVQFTKADNITESKIGTSKETHALLPHAEVEALFADWIEAQCG